MCSHPSTSSFKDCATTPCSLNNTKIKLSELRKIIKKNVIRPSQDTVKDANGAPSTAGATASTAAITEDPPSREAASVAVAAPTAAVALTATKDPPSQDAVNVAARPSC